MWTLSLLEDQARATISSFIVVDPIEVYLAYPTKLKERLKIPVGGNMLYFSCSNLTEKHLNDAAEFVENQVQYPNNFLIEQSLWNRVLQKHFPDDYPDDFDTEKLLELTKKINRTTHAPHRLPLEHSFGSDFKNSLFRGHCKIPDDRFLALCPNLAVSWKHPALKGM